MLENFKRLREIDPKYAKRLDLEFYLIFPKEWMNDLPEKAADALEWLEEKSKERLNEIQNGVL